MSYLKPIQFIVGLSVFFPTIVKSEAVDFFYAAKVELIMHDADSAGFECEANTLPAQIEIDDGRYVAAPTTSTSHSAEPPDANPIRVRRGTELVPERDQMVATGLSEGGWGMAISASIDICVGLARVNVVQGYLDVFAQLKRDERHILRSYDVLQDLNIRYKAYGSGAKQISLVDPEIDGSSPVSEGLSAGSLVSIGTPILEGLEFNDHLPAIGYTRPIDPQEVTEVSGLSVRLVLVEAATDSK